MEPDEFGGGGVGRGGVLIEHQDDASPLVQMQGQGGFAEQRPDPTEEIVREGGLKGR